jgi:hypothetical protein
MKERIKIDGVWYIRESEASPVSKLTNKDMYNRGEFIEYHPDKRYTTIKAFRDEQELIIEVTENGSPTPFFLSSAETGLIEDVVEGSCLDDYNLTDDDGLVLFIKYLNEIGWCV